MRNSEIAEFFNSVSECVSEVEQAVLAALEQSELPDLQAKWKSGEGNSIAIQKKLLESLEKEMENYRQQEEKQYEFLETGRYTPDVFDKRNAALREKIEDCRKNILEAKQKLPKAIDLKKKIADMESAIAALRDNSVSAEAKNKFLKAVVDRIEYSAEDAEDS